MLCSCSARFMLCACLRMAELCHGLCQGLPRIHLCEYFSGVQSIAGGWRRFNKLAFGYDRSNRHWLWNAEFWEVMTTNGGYLFALTLLLRIVVDSTGVAFFAPVCATWFFFWRVA